MKRFSHLCRAGLAGLLLATSSACSLLPEARPVDVYRLPASSLPASSGAPLAVTLRVLRPLSSQALDSNRIAVVPQDNLLSSYQGARWVSPAPALLRDHLLDALQRDGRLRGLSNDDSHLQADLLLDGDLRAFQVEYLDNGPQALIRIDLRLADGASQRILASRRFEVSRPLPGAQVAAAVEAFGSGSDALAREVADWLAEQAPGKR